MKVLILGAKDNFFNLENSFCRGFTKKGIDCSILDIHIDKNMYQDILDHHKVYNLFNIPFARRIVSKRMNIKIISTIKRIKPSVCFFFSLNYIFPETLNEIKKYSKVICFLADDYIFNKTFERSEISASMKQVDINFCLGKKTLKYLSKFTNSYYLPFAWDSLVNLNAKKNIINKDITFCGHFDETIFKVLKNINYHNNVSIYGSKKWTKLKPHLDNLKLRKSLEYNKYLLISKKSYINLNILRPQNIVVQSLNMRTFELGGEKCFFFQNYTNEAKNLFEDNLNDILFKDSKELNEKINFYIKNEKSRRKVVSKIYKFINAKHKYLDRVDFIIKNIK